VAADKWTLTILRAGSNRAAFDFSESTENEEDNNKENNGTTCLSITPIITKMAT